MRRSNRRPALIPTATAATLAAVLALTSGTTSAYTYRDESAGTACQGANGAASKFTYTMQYLTNVGTVDQYIVCDLTSHDVSASVLPILIFRVNYTMPQAGSSITCTVQTGSHYNGANHIVSSSSKTYTSSNPNDFGVLDWGQTIYRNSTYDVVMLNCKVSPGTRVGLIQFAEDNPPPE
jgi:hypothetical protein